MLFKGRAPQGFDIKLDYWTPKWNNRASQLQQCASKALKKALLPYWLVKISEYRCLSASSSADPSSSSSKRALTSQCEAREALR